MRTTFTLRPNKNIVLRDYYWGLYIMTKRNNLSSLLLASTILVGSTLTGTSQAEASSWMVKKVSKATTPYCAMIKRYSNDRVLSFAQRDTSQISAAIDFGDRFLDKGRAYSITLSDGDGFSRRFEVKPASSSAVVVKLNRKDPILERVARNGDLSVNIAGVLSTFNVSDLDKGLAELETCHSGQSPKAIRSADASSVASSLANIAPAAGGNSAIDTQSEAHSLYSTAANAKIRQLEQGKAELEKNLKDNEAKLAALENQVLSTENTAKTKQDALVQQINSLNSTIEKQSYELSQQKIKLTDRDEKISFYQSLDGEMNGLKEKLTIAESNLNTAMQQNNALSAQIVSLQSQGAQLGEKAAMIGQLNAQVAQLNQANASLTNELTALKQASYTNTQNAGSLAQKDAEIQNLHAALTNAQTTIASLERAMADVNTAAGQAAAAPTDNSALLALETKLKAVETEKEALNVELLSLQRELGNNKDDITIARLEKALSEANRALDRAGKENASLYQKYIQTSKDLEEAKLTKNDNQNWDVKKATSRYNEAQREIRRLAMHVENQKKQCEIEKADIEKLLFDPKITNKEQQDKLAALEGKIHDLTKTQESCNQQLAEVTSQAEEASRMAEEKSLAIEEMKQAAQAKTQATDVASVEPAAGMATAAPVSIEAAEIVKEDRSIALVSVLKSAQLDLADELQSMEGSLNLSNATFDQGYNWTSGKITGSYERYAINDGNIASWSASYNDALSAQCAGDFAVMPSKKSNASLTSNDVACVNGDFGTTSSIVYTQNGGFFEVYKLSGSIQDMAKLMEKREQLSASVKGTL